MRKAGLGARALALVLLLAATQPPRVAAQDSGVFSERAIEAAYLYQFAAYVEWPPERFRQPDTPVTIGVLGMDSLADELVQITRGRKVGDRAIIVRRVAQDDALAGLHILFIGDEAVARAMGIVTAAETESILTVTASTNGAAQGSVINFRIVGQRVRFEVFLDQARRNGLRLNSRLLAVADSVYMSSP